MWADLAGWIAPAATMIAAMMTAANLGARFTGYGFVVFLLGSIAWIAVAITTDQTNLLLTNAFLALVNIFGIWRWLGRRATYEAAALNAEQRSEVRRAEPTLFPLASLEDRLVHDRAGELIGTIIGAMAEAESGSIAYIVVRNGAFPGMDERYHALPWQILAIDEKSIHASLSAKDLKELPGIEKGRWPASPIHSPL